MAGVDLKARRQGLDRKREAVRMLLAAGKLREARKEQRKAARAARRVREAVEQLHGVRPALTPPPILYGETAPGAFLSILSPR